MSDTTVNDVMRKLRDVGNHYKLEITRVEAQEMANALEKHLVAIASPSAGAVVPAAMTETSRVPDDFRNQAAGYRAGWNDFRGCVLAAAPEVGRA